MKKLWLGATLAAIALLCVRPAAAQIGLIPVTGGRATAGDGVDLQRPSGSRSLCQGAAPVRPQSGAQTTAVSGRLQPLPDLSDSAAEDRDRDTHTPAEVQLGGRLW